MEQYINEQFLKLSSKYNQFKYKNKKYLFNNTLINWKNITKTDNNDIIKDYGIFRKKVVDKLLKYIIKSLKCNDCIVSSSGSTTLLSDYDVTTSGSQKEKIAIEFSKEFNKYFQDTSDNVFDTNVYGTEELRNHFTINKREPYMIIKRKSIYKYVIMPDGIIEDISNQRGWSFIKLFNY